MGRINRRHGCTSEFESWWSICQKLAYLNKVKFSEFISSVQLEEDTYTKNKIFRADFISSIDVQKFAVLLGEPVSHFEYSNLAPYVPNELDEISSCEGNFRYCPQCLEYGFHSPVHQLPWFEKCLIHNCILVYGCPVCRRKLGYPYDSSKNNRVDRYFCPCGEPLWSELLSSKWPNRMDRKMLQPIRSYLKWIGNLKFPGYKSLPFALDFIRYGGRDGYLSDAQWIMCCLASTLNVPDDIKSAFVEIKFPYFQSISCSDVQPIDVVQAIQSNGYFKLLKSYQYWYEQTNLRPILYKLTKSITRDLIRGHAKCLKRQLSLNDTCRNHSLSIDKFYCSNIRKAFQFSSRWLWLHDSDDNSTDMESSLALADNLGKKGLVTQTRNPNKIFNERWSSCGREIFIGDVTLDINVSAALNTLLERIWALEILKSSNTLISQPVKNYPSHTTPFLGVLSNPLVLIEVGTLNTINVWIWSRLVPSKISPEPMGGRALREHIAQVTQLYLDEEARIEEKGYWYERYMK